MSPFAARHLRHLGRAAADEGRDGTDYTRSYTARSFVPYFGQRISTACVMFGAERPPSPPLAALPACGVRVRGRSERRARLQYESRNEPLALP